MCSSDLAVRAVHSAAGEPFNAVDLATQPAAYLLVSLWAIGMVSYTKALALGELAQVTAVFQVTEVLVPGLVGIALLGDSVRSGWAAPMAAGLAVAATGVVVLTQSPVHRPERRRLRRQQVSSTGRGSGAVGRHNGKRGGQRLF